MPATTLNVRFLGPAKIHRPRPDSEYAFDQELARFYHEAGLGGVYTSSPDVTRVLGVILDRLTADLRDVLGRLGSRHAVEHLLNMDREWDRVLEALRAAALSDDDASYYRTIGPPARRAIQFALEGMVSLQPAEAPKAPRDDLVWLHDRLFLCAERMVMFADAHSQAGVLFPGDVKLDIDPFREDEELRLETTPEVDEAYQRFGRIALYDGHQAGPGFGFSRSNELITTHLDPVFQQEFGFTLTNAVEAAVMMVQGSRPPPGPGPNVNFIRLRDVVTSLAEAMERPESNVEAMLSAWILSKEGLEREDRVIWRSRQQNRLIRRPFMRLPHSSGDHLCFTREFAMSALNFSISDLVFSRLPPEWTTPGIRAALDRGVREIDQEWERAVQFDLQARGLRAVTAVEVLRAGTSRIKIPSEVGEIDLLGVAPDLSFVFVGEVKRLCRAVWAPEFTEDKAKFITGKRDYVNRFLKKVAWIDEHWQEVVQHLAFEKVISQVPKAKPPVRHAIVTEWESIAQIFTERTTIVSRKRLAEHFDATREWLFTMHR